jgi:hypothetical protein
MVVGGVAGGDIATYQGIRHHLSRRNSRVGSQSAEKVKTPRRTGWKKGRERLTLELGTGGGEQRAEPVELVVLPLAGVSGIVCEDHHSDTVALAC